MRVVLDTNVLVAAIRSPQGASFAILDQVGRGVFEHALSVPLTLEYEEQLVDHAHQLGIPVEAVLEIHRFVVVTAIPVDIRFRYRPFLSDQDDDMLVELALACSADCIVTHNLRDLRKAMTIGVSVVTPSAFLRTIRGRS